MSETVDFTWLPTGTCLVGEYGSRAHGTANEDSDRDFHGIRVEPRQFITGLSSFDHVRHSTAVQGQPSGPDDIDTTVYGLRKWALLAADGNPNVHMLPNLPEHIVRTDIGQMLLDGYPLFVTRRVIPKFHGYLGSQRHALLGERGPRVHRPELVARHSFDTKFAYHMVKVGLQGVELVRDGHMTIPFTGETRQVLLDIRAGKYALDDVLDMAADIDDELTREGAKADIPDDPDWDAINRLLNNLYEASWALSDD